MADEDGVDQERGLADGIVPIGQALRETYRADNHDSLGPDLTGLMLALARVDPPGPVEPRVVPAQSAQSAPPRGWWARLFGR